jgi:hypothetical protein
MSILAPAGASDSEPAQPHPRSQHRMRRSAPDAASCGAGVGFSAQLASMQVQPARAAMQCEPRVGELGCRVPRCAFLRSHVSQALAHNATTLELCPALFQLGAAVALDFVLALRRRRLYRARKAVAR